MDHDKLVQTVSLGLKRQVFQDTKTRYIDEENDIYPPPMMTSLPSEKITVPFEKLQFAIMYLRTNRVRSLLLEYRDNFDVLSGRDFYGYNLLAQITKSNHPTNMCYGNNRDQYDRQFFTVLENIKPEYLDALFADLVASAVAWKKLQIEEVFKELAVRPYMVMALWNYGLQYTDSQVDSYAYEPLRAFLKNNRLPAANGKRYQTLDNTCPITLKTAHVPAMLNGQIYEYANIKHHLQTSNINPLTGEELVIQKSAVYFVNGKCKDGTERISAKVLYLPEERRFEYFSIV